MNEVDILKVIPHVILSSQKKIWIDYDVEADVMYINFRYPPYSIEHEEDENGVVWNYDEKGNLTGFTVIVAKRFLKPQIQPVAIFKR